MVVTIACRCIQNWLIRSQGDSVYVFINSLAVQLILDLITNLVSVKSVNKSKRVTKFIPTFMCYKMKVVSCKTITKLMIVTKSKS